MVIISPAGAPAQFTGVVAQPRKAEAVTATTTTAATAASDTMRQTRLADMRAWVDSAAQSLGVSTHPAGTDSSALPATTTTATQSTTSTGEVASMSTGLPAPDTASTLPLVALVGAVFLSAGAFLFSTRRGRHDAESHRHGA